MRQDLTGKRFGRLVVLREIGKDDDYNYIWECKCDCGNITTAKTSGLNRGKPRSCGCLKLDVAAELIKQRVTTHGKSKTRLYNRWCKIKDRCYNEKVKSYHDYGARGIKMCDDWLNFETFYKWAINNGYKEELTIERKDVNKGYCPENCTWIPMLEQAKNRRSNIMITMNGKTHYVAEWSKILGINPKTIYTRLSRGVKVEDCLKPVI